MRAAWAVFRKELLEAVRDRRTLLLGLLLPVIVMPAVTLGLPYLALREEARLRNAPARVAVVGASELREFIPAAPARGRGGGGPGAPSRPPPAPAGPAGARSGEVRHCLHPGHHLGGARSGDCDPLPAAGTPLRSPDLPLRRRRGLPGRGRVGLRGLPERPPAPPHPGRPERARGPAALYPGVPARGRQRPPDPDPAGVGTAALALRPV